MRFRIMTISFLRLESPFESTNHLPQLSKGWLDELELKWATNPWSQYDNLHYEICTKICNDVYSSYKYWEQGKTHSEFLGELTRAQRAYFVLINFTSQVNNGGVYQFLSNLPELSIIALEAMQEVEMGQLVKDYEDVLIEFFGKFDSFEQLNARFENENLSWEERWEAFESGYEELPAAEKIEDYFYEEHYVMNFQSKLIHYVKLNAIYLFRNN
ncbi:DMP19 family protein [Gilvibacter sediminis]|uniref:DMP19 family protein n=1 Tax=Gilvibacter sediminis TaxID=379071 RepID=UPI0023504BC9|nr:DUF4375 domain-containing protein [Gilvibacter sediminis]MDC7997709.1 DUF4375 domain-containing protein [Gilvibacter sediminis]